MPLSRVTAPPVSRGHSTQEEAEEDTVEDTATKGRKQSSSHVEAMAPQHLVMAPPPMTHLLLVMALPPMTPPQQVTAPPPMTRQYPDMAPPLQVMALPPMTRLCQATARLAMITSKWSQVMSSLIMNHFTRSPHLTSPPHNMRSILKFIKRSITRCITLSPMWSSPITAHLTLSLTYLRLMVTKLSSLASLTSLLTLRVDTQRSMRSPTMTTWLLTMTSQPMRLTRIRCLYVGTR